MVQVDEAGADDPAKHDTFGGEKLYIALEASRYGDGGSERTAGLAIRLHQILAQGAVQSQEQPVTCFSCRSYAAYLSVQRCRWSLWE
jgi:hypothetical protein